MFEESLAPLYALDAQRRIVFASRSAGAWVGVEAEKLVGLRCDYHTGGDGPLTSAASALCPPPEAFLGQLDAGTIGPLAQAGQASEPRPARFVRLALKPESDEFLLLVIAQPPTTSATPAVGAERLHALLAQLRSELGQRYHTSQLIGESDAIRRVREQVRIAAASGARTIVVGPPGSGREHVARTIHYAHPAASLGPLVPIACPLVDAEQMQQALAGVLRRQVESPTERPPGALLLDVDRLRPDAQQELAGFLQLPNLELHTLATARRPLSRLAAKGKFRPDLAIALSTLTISLPPLSARRTDIPLLAQHFVEEFNADGGPQRSGLSPAAAELLLSLPWPGNLDELAAAVREACRRASGPQLTPADFPDWVHLAESAARLAPRDEKPIRLDELLESIEREVLQRALRQARGNKTKAAELLGIQRNRLLRRLAQFGLIEPAAAEEPVIFEPLPEES